MAAYATDIDSRLYRVIAKHLGTEVDLELQDEHVRRKSVFTGWITEIHSQGFVVSGANWRVFVSFVDLYARFTRFVSGKVGEDVEPVIQEMRVGVTTKTLTRNLAVSV